jgi:hypothetical protein
LSHKLLLRASYHGVLWRIDQDLAAQCRAARCRCGGRLDVANYPRKPRGGPELPTEQALRLSFCCAAEGCRRRSTPPSTRFLGRRVYFGTVVVVLSRLAERCTRKLLAKLRTLVGDVSERTVGRWLRWWREVFPKTAVFAELRGRVPAVAQRSCPRSLWSGLLAGGGQERLVSLLRLLLPLSSTALRLALDPCRTEEATQSMHIDPI